MRTRILTLVLTMTIPFASCTQKARGVVGGTAIVIGGLGAVSAAQTANSNPDCINCDGDTGDALVVLGGSLALALIGVAIIAVDVVRE